MMRTVLSLVMSLVLLVTSHSVAMARGGSEAVDRMVICTGTAAVMVYIDAEGQPTAAPHLCPDCALHLLAAILPPDADIVTLGHMSLLRPHAHSVSDTRAARLPGKARGPPALT